MSKTIKRILLSVLFAVFCFSLVACGTSGVLPDIKGARKISEAEAKAIYEELTQQTVEIDFKSIKGYVVDEDENFYYEYIETLEKSGYEYEGATTIRNVKMTMFSYPSKDNQACLVAYRDGEMYVIEFIYETVEASTLPFVWFTQEELALFRLRLTEPTGEVKGVTSVANSKKDVGVFYDSLYLRITNKDKTQYNNFKQELILSGYTLGKMEEEVDYSANLVYNNVEFSCHLAYENGVILLNVMNETQKTKFDFGATLYSVYKTGTVGIKSVGYEYYQDGKDVEKYGQVERYEYFSYSETKLLEFYFDGLIEGEISDAFLLAGGYLTDFTQRRDYYWDGSRMVASNELGINGGWYTLENYIHYRSFSNIQRYYYNARELRKTGVTRTIAGVNCAEYVGKVSMNNGESVWDATFCIWEETGIPMYYKGNKWFDDDSEYILEIAYISTENIANEVLNLNGGSSSIGAYPNELVKEKSKLTFDFSVEGADGYRWDRTQFDCDADGNEVACTAFDAYGVDRTELNAYTNKLKGLGFTGEIHDDQRYVLYYVLASGDRIKIQVSYDKEGETLCFYFVEEIYEKTVLPTNGLRLNYQATDWQGKTKRGFVEFVNGKNVHFGLYGGESDNEYHYYAKRVDGYYEVYSATREAELFDSQPRKVLAKDLGSALFNGLGFKVLVEATSALEYCGTLDEDVYGVPATVYKNSQNQELVLWDGYNIILKDELSGLVKLICLEEEFEEMMPTVNAEKVEVYNRWKRWCSQDRREEYLAWLYDFYASTYGSYQEKVYQGYTLTEYNKFKQKVFALENSGWTVLSQSVQTPTLGGTGYHFTVTMTNGAKRVAEIFASYNTEDGYALASVVEYDVAKSVGEYFGDEFDRKEYIDYSKIDGKYTVRDYEINEDPNEFGNTVMMRRTVAVDWNGTICIDGDSFAYVSVFNANPTVYTVDVFGSKRVLIEQRKETVSSAKEWLFSRMGDLSEYCDVTSFSTIGTESVAGVTCTVYKGSYVYRGQTLELTVWRASDGRNMRVKKGVEQRGPYKRYWVYDVLEFERGSFSGFESVNEISSLPVTNKRYQASEWKDEYYGFDFMPRVEGFGSFEFVPNGTVFYGDTVTVKAVPSGTFEYDFATSWKIRRLDEHTYVEYYSYTHEPTQDKSYSGSIQMTQVVVKEYF